MDFKSNSPVRIAHIKNESDFWIYNESDELYHFSKGVWTRVKLNSNTKNRIYKYLYVGDGNFLAAIVNEDWHTQFYEVKSHTFINSGFQHEMPIQNLASFKNQLYYAYGNFGAFVIQENGIWKEIETPIVNHINTSLAISRDSIWLGTKVDGVFLFTAGKFREIPIESDDIPVVIEFKYIGKALYFRSNKNETFKLEENKFVNIDWKDSPWHTPIRGKNKIGMAKYIYSEESRETREYYYPVEMRVATIKPLNKNELLATTINGEVYKGTITEESFFIDLADAYQINTGKYHGVFSTGLRDINNDGLLDIEMLGSRQNNLIYMFRGNKNFPFTLTTATATISQTEFNYFMTLGDLDWNNFPEIILGRYDSLGYKLSVYKNLGDFNFSDPDDYYLSQRMQTFGSRGISMFDFNNDNDLDISVDYYYGQKDKPGHIGFMLNDFYGQEFVEDTSFFHLSDVWLEHVIYGDFDNNDLCDAYLLNRWGKNRLLFQYPHGWKDRTGEFLSDYEYGESEAGCSFDYDNDGDLDLFLVERKYFLRIFENNGSGNFHEVSDSLLNVQNFVPGIQDFTRTMSTGDFNNDGFIDIFISDGRHKSAYNYLLVNNEGRQFTDNADLFLVRTPCAHNSSIGDIDNDGDLDLLGISESEIMLWINQLDNKSYIRIKPVGVISNNDALFAKIYLYVSKDSDNHKTLVGFRQLGSDKYSVNQENENVAHFGVRPGHMYDATIEFYNGEKKEVKDIKPGSYITVSELSGFSSFIYSFPRRIIQTITDSSFQLYLVTSTLSVIIILLSIRYGSLKFRWEPRLITLFTLLDASILWASFMLLSDSSEWVIRFLLPVLIILVASLVPILVFHYLSGKNYKSINEVSDTLLQLLINFSHGGWALKNLNSLQLLYENMPSIPDENYISQLNERKKTFLDLTLKGLSDIIKLSKTTSIGTRETKNLSDNLDLLNANIRVQNNYPVREEVTSSIRNLKKDLSILRQEIYKVYSTDSIEVIKSILEQYQQTFQKDDIKIEKLREITEDTTVLIKNYELADVMNNLISNAVKSFGDVRNKFIRISVRELTPKIIIEFSNNGRIIEKQYKTKIFERGFSGTGSTGHGLFHSRKTIEKYGGRLLLSESNDTITTFIIELSEGVKNETNSSSN